MSNAATSSASPVPLHGAAAANTPSQSRREVCDSANPGFTPGPWTVHPFRAVIIPAVHIGRPLGFHEDPAIDLVEYAQEICALHWPDRNRSEDEVGANGSLIAAVPDLYMALLELMPKNLGAIPASMADSDTLPLDVSIGELRKALAALAKVGGAA